MKKNIPRDKATPPSDSPPSTDSFACDICPVCPAAERPEQSASPRSPTATRANHAALIKATLAHIHATPDGDLTLAHLAGRAGLSAFHFARVFRRETGLSVRQHVIGCRLEFARQRLADTNISISRIALDAGFCSQSHLTTVFRRTLGITPKAYRDGARRAASSEVGDASAAAPRPSACPRRPNADHADGPSQTSGEPIGPSADSTPETQTER